MATDSVMEFNYSDDVHLATIYIQSDTHIETFIPMIADSLSQIVNMNRHEAMKLNWDYVVTDLIAKLVYDDSLGRVRLIPKTKPAECNTIYRHVIHPIEDLYNDEDVDVTDCIWIHSSYPISGKVLHDGFISKYSGKVEGGGS